MKKLIGLMSTLPLIVSLCACSTQPAAEQNAGSGTAAGSDAKEASESADTNTGEVTQADIEANIVGTWVKSEVDGEPAPTDEKSVYDIPSVSEAYISVSRKSDNGTVFEHNQKGEVDINGNVVTITEATDEGESIVHEFTITSISENEFTADKKFTHTLDDSDPVAIEYNATFVKVNDDYSDDIIGAWEGRCTSEGSIYDDGQDHRWEYKEDGTYVYYVKDGDSWVLSTNTMNEYFVAGNLLGTRWMDGNEEFVEWWELSIDSGKMNWTATREGDDGKRFTTTFEMTKVEE